MFTRNISPSFIVIDIQTNNVSVATWKADEAKEAKIAVLPSSSDHVVIPRVPDKNKAAQPTTELIVIIIKSVLGVGFEPTWTIVHWILGPTP